MKFSCPRAFALKKYIGLFTAKDLNYFENEYRKKSKVVYKINSEKLTNVIPNISEHSENYYEKYLNNIDGKYTTSTEFPSWQINGIYLSEDGQMALLSHSMISSILGGGMVYSIMKKEDGVWWRYIGSIPIMYV